MTHDPAAICYRMEPSRRFSTGDRCPPTCPEHYGTSGGEMPPCLLSVQRHTVVDLEPIRRVALMVTPQAGGEVLDQAWEALSTVRAILRQQTVPMQVTVQTVFLRRAGDLAACRRLFEAYYGDRMPATNFLVQPPCGGEALAIEAWAVGGEEAACQFYSPHLVSVSYDGLRWIHCAGIQPFEEDVPAYDQAAEVFWGMNRLLQDAGAAFADVVRTWFYQGGITEPERGLERYRELNRGRADFYRDVAFGGNNMAWRNGHACYPASTGIGTRGLGLSASCLALQTKRTDVRLVPLENPRQTPSFHYDPCYSEESPRFSRAMAVRIGGYLTTWISGTASIVDSESRHAADVVRQTEQTLDNIEHLISPSNFERHGLPGAGAGWQDLAKVRVYLKHPEDYETCRLLCEQRFGSIPAIYALADVCRPELLVEIEGVAFSRLSSGA